MGGPRPRNTGGGWALRAGGGGDDTSRVVGSDPQPFYRSKVRSNPISATFESGVGERGTIFFVCMSLAL